MTIFTKPQGKVYIKMKIFKIRFSKSHLKEIRSNLKISPNVFILVSKTQGQITKRRKDRIKKERKKKQIKGEKTNIINHNNNK